MLPLGGTEIAGAKQNWSVETFLLEISKRFKDC